MTLRKLQLAQLERKMEDFSTAASKANPATGWIKTIRSALGMTLQQLANKLSMTRQGVKELEMREQEGSISLKSLRDAGKALNMKLVYGFVPMDGTLDALIDKKTHALATKIVTRTSQSMKLEDQENSETRIKKAIEERKEILKQELPKMLWD